MKKILEEPGKGRRFAFLLFLCAALAIVTYSFVTIPLATDAKVFLAAANQVQYQEHGGLLGIFEAWELKGIGNRFFVYCLYSLTTRLAQFGRMVAFGRVAKALYAVFIFATLGAASSLIEQNRLKKLFFGISVFGIMATWTMSHLQAEMTTTVVCLSALAMLLKKKTAWCFWGGVLLSFPFWFKSVLVLDCVVVMAGLFFLDEDARKRPSAILKPAGTGFAAALLAEIAFVLLVYPQEFKDMAAAAEFQKTLFSAGSAVSWQTIAASVQDGLLRSFVGIPLLLLGVMALLQVAAESVRRKKWAQFTALLVMWGVPFDVIVASNVYFQYHFFLLAFPSIVTLLFYLKEKEHNANLLCMGCLIAFAGVAACWALKSGLEQVAFINYSTTLLLVVHLLVCFLAFSLMPGFEKAVSAVIVVALAAAVFFYANYSSLFAPKYWNLLMLERWSQTTCDKAVPNDIHGGEVLFLDVGTAAFCIDAKSYSRYFFNLPLQRNQDEKEKPEIATQELEKLLQYKGKYIVCRDHWLKLEQYPELAEKLSKEYTVRSRSKFNVHKPDHDVFRLRPKTGKIWYLLERKLGE